MTLTLTLEAGPQPQAVRQMRLDTGSLVVGRGADADWRIDDPSMFVSRAHCTIAAAATGFTVTDTSSGGLYVDDARAPLGAGRSAMLHDGTRLRLGDYVLRVEIAAEARPAAAPAQPPSRTPARFDRDTFFDAAPAAPPPPRPANLPDPFERPSPGGHFAAAPAPPERRPPPAFDDPFTLDPLPSARPPEPARNGGFDWSAPPPPEPAPTRPEPQPTGFDWNAGPRAEPARPEPPSPPAPREAARAHPADPGLRDAFLRGLGFEPADYPSRDPAAQMEDFGRAHRLMLEGLMHLLRKRAQEKSNARLAQTVVGASEVNPLKFMPTVDDALATLLAERSPGFLGPDAAITGAVRDLAQHHVSAWRGLQSALGAMIDRFDPKALEEELKAHSALEKLLAGGRRAKLWELYEERYREIAKSAETRFLGEVGADFREAYEKKGD